MKDSLSGKNSMKQGKDFEMRLLSIKCLFGEAMANNLEDRYMSLPGE